MRIRAVGLVAVLALVAASCGGGVPEAAGPSEGIQVHGDWTIEIYNEDGSLDQRVEFTNGLRAPGRKGLARLLAGEAYFQGNSTEASTGWRVVFGQTDLLFGDPGVSPCNLDVFHSSNPVFTKGCTLNTSLQQLEVQLTSEDFDVLTLTGSIDAEQDGFVNWVETQLVTLHSTENTAFSNFYSFTGTVKDPEVSVAAGQTIQIQVDISFTSG